MIIIRHDKMTNIYDKMTNYDNRQRELRKVRVAK